jgi:hypothetical protein
VLKFIGAVTCVGFAALVLVVLFAVAGSHGSPSPASEEANPPTLGPAMRVSAMKLALDYHANEVQADNVYRGQHLLVTGLVTSINKDALGGIYLELASDNEIMHVDARLQASAAEAAARLHVMQLVHVDCVGGEMVIGSPQLNNCTIVPDEPVASPQSSSEPQVSSEPSPSDENSKPILSDPPTDEATGTTKDSASADSSSGDTREGQAPQQPPAPIERH